MATYINLRQDWQHTGGRGHVRIVDGWDEAEGVTKFAMLSWDTGTLAWVRFTGSAGGGGGGGPATIADGADVTQGAKSDAVWDGAAASPTRQSLAKYMATKLEAIRALLAGTLTVAGTVTANTGLTQPLTDAQIRATPLPVSGTVTANTGLTQPLTDTQLRATPVPVSGTFFPGTQPVSAAALPLPAGAATETGLAAILNGAAAQGATRPTRSR
jgi:hypothetical protein